MTGQLLVRTLSPPVRQALKVALRRRGLTEGLDPVALLPGGRVVCRDTGSGHAATATMADGQVIEEYFPISVDSWLQEMRLLLQSYEVGWSIARSVAQRRADAHMQPRDTDLQLLDVRSRDHVLGLTVFRWDPRRGCISVHVAMTCGSPVHEPTEGARLQLLQLLAVAARTGGRLQLVFESSVEGGRIPRAYVDFATQLGVPLRAGATTLDHEDAVDLLVAMLNVGETTKSRLRSLPLPERAALLVLQGTLEAHELEGLLASGPCRDLLAGAAPDHPLWRRAVGALLRSERLATRFEVALINPDGASPLAIEDSGKSVDVEVAGSATRMYTARQPNVVLPWVISTTVLPEGESVEVRCREWDSGLAKLLLPTEMEVGPKPTASQSRKRVVVVLPADAADAVECATDSPPAADVTFVVSPITRLDLDRDVARTLRLLEAMGGMSS